MPNFETAIGVLEHEKSLFENRVRNLNDETKDALEHVRNLSIAINLLKKSEGRKSLDSQLDQQAVNAMFRPAEEAQQMLKQAAEQEACRKELDHFRAKKSEVYTRDRYNGIGDIRHAEEVGFFGSPAQQGNATPAGSFGGSTGPATPVERAHNNY